MQVKSENPNDIAALDRIRVAFSALTSEEIMKYLSIFYEQIKLYLDKSIL